MVIADGESAYFEEEDGNFVLWYGYNSTICLGDLQQSALHILNVMLYSQDMRILCEDLDDGLGLDINYEDTQYAKGFSEAMNAPLAILK